MRAAGRFKRNIRAAERAFFGGHGRGRRRFFKALLKPGDLFNDRKNTKSHDQKIDDVVDEHPVIQRGRSGGLRFGLIRRLKESRGGAAPISFLRKRASESRGRFPTHGLQM